MRVPRSTVEFCPSKHRGLPKLSESLKYFEVYREVSTAQLRGTPCVSVEHRVPPWNLPLAYVADFLLNYIYATARLRGTPWASVEFTLVVDLLTFPPPRVSMEHRGPLWNLP